MTLDQSPTAPSPDTRTQIEYLATKVMGWTRIQVQDPYWWDKNGHGTHEAWNPLEEWNHFRQVEEKVMEDGELVWAMLQQLDGMLSNKDSQNRVGSKYMRADLLTRVSALISAHQELYGN